MDIGFGVMRNLRKLVGGVGLAVLLVGIGPARSEVVSDESAAILLWPDVVAIQSSSPDITGQLDTVIQLSNTSTQPILVHCFYENATPHCTNTGSPCVSFGECCEPGGCGTCEPGWVETDFRVRLTPRQPLGWRASTGLQEFPLTGAIGSVGPDGSSNAGSNVPAVAERVYTGLLKCIAINDDGTPSDRNVLKGEATRVFFRGADDDPSLLVAKHNAIGIRALDGAVNGDRELVLGGPEPEYEGCPEVLIVNHFFDWGENPAVEDRVNLTRLVLVPCTQNLRAQIPGSSVVQYVVYNEFEQRFSTSRSVTCKADYLLSTIDTQQSERSIFSAGVSGTLVGQSRLRPIGSGLVGIATEVLAPSSSSGSFTLSVGALPDYTGLVLSGGPVIQAADFNIHQQAERADPDIISLP